MIVVIDTRLDGLQLIHEACERAEDTPLGKLDGDPDVLDGRVCHRCGDELLSSGAVSP